MSVIVDKFQNSKDIEFLASIKSDAIDLTQVGVNDILKELDRNYKVIITDAKFLILQTEEDAGEEIEIQLSQKGVNIFSKYELTKSDVLGSIENIDFEPDSQINFKDGLQCNVIAASETNVKGVLIVNFIRVPDEEIKEEIIEE